MFMHFVGTLWRSLAPGLADHLWQSTLFAAAAALLTVALRRNSARLRYAVWLVASLKFLVPFSLLVAAGSVFSWRHAPVAATSGMYVVEVVGQPFTRPLAVSSAAVPAHAGSAALTQLFPLLLCVWLVGFFTVLCVWIARWWQVVRVLRSSTPLTAGREHSILRRLEELQSSTVPIRLAQSDASLEPGVFGIFRPVLLWPRSVSEHLDDAHLEAVIAHELCHVRRRDNLAAILHMVVEAVFWFHPLVWWIGAQLIAERERATKR
jgi:bla regulator protein blaR1